MDKKLNRVIGYVKPSGVTQKQVGIKEPPKVAEEPKGEVDLLAAIEAAKGKAKKIVKWINEHEEFKWGVMCTKLKIDRGNFQRTLNSNEPSIKIELVLQIENFLTAYGYAG